MAISAATVFEVRTTGSDTACSGGFVAGASGTDYSQQNAAQYSLTGLTSSGVGNVILSATASADMVGNLINITAGTNFTLGEFQITAVSLGVSITCSTNNAGASVTTGVGAAGTAVIGGAFISPGFASAQIVAANSVHIKSGTYTISNGTAKTSGGPVSDTLGANWYGYQTTRFDFGTQPLLQVAASGVTAITIFSQTGGTATNIQNIGFDGQSKTSITGFSSSRGNQCYRLYALNCTVIGISPGSGTYLSCYATGCSGTAAFSVTSSTALFACQSYSSTTVGFLVSGFASLTVCVAYSNSGATSDGFQTSGFPVLQFTNCTAYGNGRAGFRIAAGGGFLVNCVAESNTGKGFDTNSTAQVAFNLKTCAGFGNSVNVDASFTGQNMGFITYTSTAFISSTNFALNTTVGGGASLRATGFPGTFPNGLTTGFIDVGAVQHADPAGSSTVIYPIFD